MTKIIEEIRDSLRNAEMEKKESATFHSLVLIHAAELEAISPDEFCRRVGVAKSYEIEFRKMISASRRLAEFGYCIQRK